MSRIDEALRRARPDRSEPEAFHESSAAALDWFAPADAVQPDADPAGAAPASTDAASSAPNMLLSFPLATAKSPEDAPAPQPPEDTSLIALTAETPAIAPPVDPPAGIASEHAWRLITGGTLRPVTIEQYRRIAAVLHHVQRDRGAKVVMISSAIPGEGKTLTASNLALTLSESYQRNVLLIDADLRRPMVHETFGVPNINGLSGFLDAFDDVQPGLVKVTEHLTVLPAGEPNPDPLSGLTSHRMKRLVSDAREHFDWVIVDTPPVGVLPDANLLGSIIDAALLVVGAGRTPLKVVQEAVAALGRERILGVVLNRVDLKNISGHYAGYDGYGYSGYGSKKAGYFSKSKVGGYFSRKKSVGHLDKK